MKVYVVEKGVYSDRHIVGVTESQEEAKEIARVVAGARNPYYVRDDITITEYDTKAFASGRFKFLVIFCDDEVTVECLSINQGIIEDDYTETSYIPELDEYVVFARDKEQAVKIARDMEAQRKAEEAGVAL
jgi:hypothetical protein